MNRALDQVRSVKVKLGLLVAISVTVASVVAAIGADSGTPFWLSIPVTVALALGVTQLLAVGMTSPLREMTAAARQMARGDYAGRVTATSSDEVGDLARAFNRMAEDLAAVDQQRRDLVANVSHELRTPLAALCAVLENLADGVGEADPAALRTALRQAERLSALASDLLDLARVDAGKAPLSTAPLRVLGLLQSAVAEAESTGRAVRYEVLVAPPDLTVTGDPARLHQLVANLLDNASRHSPAGGLVRISAEGVPGGWHLEVADDGPGVPVTDRERVFERFGTLTETAGGGGTGLGLAIARWVTDLHGGTITFVDPPPDLHGARVRVALPAGAGRTTGSVSPTTPPQPVPNEPVPVAAQEILMSNVASPPPPPPVHPTAYPADFPSGHARPAEPSLDQLFGRFWPEEGVAASSRAVLACLGVGLLAAIVLPFRDLGLGTFLVLLAAGATVLRFSVHRRSAFTLTCAALCALLAATVVVRDAQWIVLLCLFAGGAVCMAGLVNGRTLPAFVLAGVAWPLAGLRGLPWLGRSMRAVTGQHNSAALLRTVVWSVLGLVVFGLLFASADALFKEWAGAVLPDLHLSILVLRLFVTIGVGGSLLGAAYLALNPPNVEPGPLPSRPVTHRYEWLAPVLLIDAVFGVFLAAQVTVLFGGHDYLARTTGLTYAEYVHQGFAQLTVATALTVLVVWAAACKAPRETASDLAWVRGSLGLLCALTLVVVASALHRMHVYQEAYGFTRLRLLVDVFEGWLGLVVVGVVLAGLLRSSAWLGRAALLSGAAALLALAAVNPDGWIASHNVDRYATTGKVDVAYLQGLSADAAPALAALPADLARCVLDHRPSHDDWLELNLGRHRAAAVLREHSRGGPATCPTADAG